MITNLTHSEICAVAAQRLGDKTTSEMVDKTVKTYAESCFDLIKEKAPTNEKDKLLVETPMVGAQVKYHQTGVKKNPDGTETKTGPYCSIQYAAPKALLKMIGLDLFKNLGSQVISTVIDAKKKAA